MSNFQLDTYCPGAYCGRLLVNGSFGDCGGCPRGFRSNHRHICVECSQDLLLYDWIYLSFMVIVFVVVQCYFIDRSIKSNKFNCLAFTLYLVTFCESLIAASFSVLFFKPRWELSLQACRVKSFSDWYTLFYNPTLHENFYCTQEAVYPLYSIVFVFYICSLCLVLTRHLYLRVICFVLYFFTSVDYVKRLYPKECITTNTYFILYSIPALMFGHAIFAGIIYYIYPFMILVGSVISVAVHLARHIDQSPLHLLCLFTQFRNLCVILFHWCLHAFSIVALTELRDVSDYLLFLLVPLPTFFYILTTKYSDPASL